MSSVSSPRSPSERGRRCFVGGNWKSNGTRSSVSSLVSSLNSSSSSLPSSVDIVVAPTYIHLEYVKSNIKPPFLVSAQNCNFAGPGAYTGEISAAAIKDFGLNWTIVGHSERRSIYHTTDEIVGKQLKEALKEGLSVIACVGETLDERKANKTMDVVLRQLSALVSPIGSSWDRIVIAYEPVWAIGTGQVATPEQAQEVHAAIRSWLTSTISSSVSGATRVIYGGSVTSKNAVELINKPDIDGFLVGGASLKADEFIKICQAPGQRKGKL